VRSSATAKSRFAATTTGITNVVAILELADAAHLDRYLTEQVGARSPA
jgi:hypothetical protein